MFDFLKKKISGFIDGITRKEDEKAAMEGPRGKPAPEPEARPPERGIAPGKAAPREGEKPHLKAEAPPPPEPEKAAPQRKAAAPKQEAGPEAPPAKDKPEAAPRPPEPAPEKAVLETAAGQKKAERPVKKAAHAPAVPAKPVFAEPSPHAARLVPEASKPPPEPETRASAPKKPVPAALPPKPEPQPAAPRQAPAEPETETPRPAEAPRAMGPEKPKERLKLGIVGTVKSIITREVEIGERDVREMAESLELELLEADVEMSVAESIREELTAKLVGSRVPRSGLQAHISGKIRETLVDMLANERDFDILERVESGEKPVKIMFIGINGAGKTTTIAKVAKLLMDGRKKVVFAAADTFRAAAIEQMGVHADRLGVKMIKREYGSDPTSVAYDAVNYAKAHGIDAVLIDTAGRQDTNISLLNEMKKMRRVINPDICIYIGESIAGNAILEQISAFDREVGVDAVILSKLDCDPKGGTMLSISKATGVPIIYVGVGQGYDALERFDPARIVSRIVE